MSPRSAKPSVAGGSGQADAHAFERERADSGGEGRLDDDLRFGAGFIERREESGAGPIFG